MDFHSPIPLVNCTILKVDSHLVMSFIKMAETVSFIKDTFKCSSQVMYHSHITYYNTYRFNSWILAIGVDFPRSRIYDLPAHKSQNLFLLKYRFLTSVVVSAFKNSYYWNLSQFCSFLSNYTVQDCIPFYCLLYHPILHSNHFLSREFLFTWFLIFPPTMMSVCTSISRFIIFTIFTGSLQRPTLLCVLLAKAALLKNKHLIFPNKGILFAISKTFFFYSDTLCYIIAHQRA